MSTSRRRNISRHTTAIWRIWASVSRERLDLRVYVPGIRCAGCARRRQRRCGAKLRVTYEGESIELTPKVRLVTSPSDPVGSIMDLPAALPGGHQATLAAFDPLQRRVLIRVEGLNLPVDPAKAVITLSLKPGVMLVWLGVIIGVTGGLIAVVRRTLEGRGALEGRRVRLPRGFGELARFVSLR